MTDEEDTRIVNATALSITRKALGEVIPGEGFGVDKEKYHDIYEKISIMLDEVHKAIEVGDGT